MIKFSITVEARKNAADNPVNNTAVEKLNADISGVAPMDAESITPFTVSFDYLIEGVDV